MTASGPRSLLCTNLVSAPCLPNSHPQGRRELLPPDLRVLSPLHTLTSPSAQTCGSPKNLLFAHSFTVHGSFRERGEMLTHAHTCTHMREHTHAHTCTHGFLATVLPSLSGNRKCCHSVGPERSKNRKCCNFLPKEGLTRVVLK